MGRSDSEASHDCPALLPSPPVGEGRGGGTPGRPATFAPTLPFPHGGGRGPDQAGGQEPTAIRRRLAAYDWRGWVLVAWIGVVGVLYARMMLVAKAGVALELVRRVFGG